MYPGAALISVPNTASPTNAAAKPTPAELDEPATLILLVAGHYGCLTEEVAEIRKAAARDPASALASFLQMARELGLDTEAQEPQRYLTADQWLNLGEYRKTQT